MSKAVDVAMAAVLLVAAVGLLIGSALGGWRQMCTKQGVFDFSLAVWALVLAAAVLWRG